MSDKNLEKRLRKIVDNNETREELIQVGYGCYERIFP